MSLGVFIVRPDSIYKDSPAEQYQFPAQYLSRAQPCVGSWILYYEPRKVANTRGYFAAAKVNRIIPDPSTQGMYLALIEPGSCIDFPRPVPFAGPDGPIERGVLNAQGRISGRAQSAVRPISASDFNRIVALGLDDDTPLLPRTGDPERGDRLREEAPIFLHEQAPFAYEHDRPRLATLVSRPIRDRVFRRVVLRAYDERCAITGLKLINGGGRAEVEAAHIRAVEANGPDSVGNGLALSGTAHWMFDRGLLSLADDHAILVSRQANDPDSIRGIINKSGYALPPARMADRPHPHFLAWHRDHCFKQ